MHWPDLLKPSETLPIVGQSVARPNRTREVDNNWCPLATTEWTINHLSQHALSYETLARKGGALWTG